MQALLTVRNIHLDSAPKYSVLSQLAHPQDKILLSTEDLARLIPAAQAQDEQAMITLRRGFATLILEVAGKDCFYNVLGVDAVNIAWEIFFKSVIYYKGKDFQRFPGLVKDCLYKRLYKALCREKYKSAPFLEGANPADMEDVPGLDDPENSAINRAQLSQALAELSPKQRQAIYDYYYLGITPLEQAKRGNKSVQAVYANIRSGLLKLKRIIKPYSH